MQSDSLLTFFFTPGADKMRYPCPSWPPGWKLFLPVANLPVGLGVNRNLTERVTDSRSTRKFAVHCSKRMDSWPNFPSWIAVIPVSMSSPPRPNIMGLSFVATSEFCKAIHFSQKQKIVKTGSRGPR